MSVVRGLIPTATFLAATDMKTLPFERCAGDAGYWFTFWPEGELRIFRDQRAAESFAKRKGLVAEFKGYEDARPQSEVGGIEYRFLGVTGEEDA